jgi:hypothetical protein
MAVNYADISPLSDACLVPVCMKMNFSTPYIWILKRDSNAGEAEIEG